MNFIIFACQEAYPFRRSVLEADAFQSTSSQELGFVSHGTGQAALSLPLSHPRSPPAPRLGVILAETHGVLTA